MAEGAPPHSNSANVAAAMRYLLVLFLCFLRCFRHRVFCLARAGLTFCRLITTKAPPGLTYPGKWSSEFNAFITKCVTREPSSRPTALDFTMHNVGAPACSDSSYFFS